MRDKFNCKSVNDLIQPYFIKLKRGKNRVDRRFTSTYINETAKNLSEAWSRYGEDFYNSGRVIRNNKFQKTKPRYEE